MILTAACVAGCDSTSTEPEQADLVVVEAFLFVGEPIDDIRLTETVPLSDTIDAPPINDASVVLYKNGLSYTLVPTGDSGYYAYPGDDLSIEVYQGTSTVSWIYCSIGLNEVLIISKPDVGPALVTDYSCSDRVLQAEGIPHSHNPLANF